MYNSRISGLGYYVPNNVVTNDDLSKIMETNDAWIQERTGIQERRHVIQGEDTTTSMGVKAAKIAIERAGLTKDDIDFIVFATLKSRLLFSWSRCVGTKGFRNANCWCLGYSKSMFWIRLWEYQLRISI